MDRKLTAVALTLVLVTSALGVAGAGSLADVTQQAANDGGDSATVSASASGQVTAQPNQAVVHVSVTATGETATEATDRLADNVSTFRAAMDDENLSVVSVNTTSYHVTQQDGHGQGEARGEGQEGEYLARQSFAVTTDDINGTGAIVDAAVDGGADEIRGVQFTISDERRQELRADAIDDAVTDARAQAEAAASSTGLTITGVDSVSVNTGHGPFAFADVEQAGAGGTDIDPSPVSVSASVDITYNATSD